MTVTLTSPYAGYQMGATVTLSADTEAALVQQNLARRVTGQSAQNVPFVAAENPEPTAPFSNLVLRPRGGLLGALGHSWIEQAFASPTSDAPRSWLYWLALLSGGRLSYRYDTMFGKAGDTSMAIDAARPGFRSRLPALLASPAQIVIVSDDTNAWAAGRPASESIANMGQIFADIRAAGKQPVAWMPTPRGGAFALTGTQLAAQAAYGNWLRSNADAMGVLVADATPLLVDPTAATLAPRSGYFTDDLHASILGGSALGGVLWDRIAPYLSRLDPLSYNISDTFDASYNANGNLLTNPAMRGSRDVTVAPTSNAGGGTLSGTVADGWRFNCSNCAGLTIAASVVTVGNRRMQQVQITGTPTAGNWAVWLRQDGAASAIQQGDQLVARGYVEVDAGTTGVTGLGIQQWTNDARPSAQQARRTGDSVGAANGQFPAVAFSGAVATGANPTDANPTGFYGLFGAAGLNGIAVNLTARWSNLDIRKQ